MPHNVLILFVLNYLHFLLRKESSEIRRFYIHLLPIGSPDASWSQNAFIHPLTEDPFTAFRSAKFHTNSQVVWKEDRWVQGLDCDFPRKFSLKIHQPHRPKGFFRFWLFHWRQRRSFCGKRIRMKFFIACLIFPFSSMINSDTSRIVVSLFLLDSQCLKRGEKVYSVSVKYWLSQTTSTSYFSRQTQKQRVENDWLSFPCTKLRHVIGDFIGCPDWKMT